MNECKLLVRTVEGAHGDGGCSVFFGQGERAEVVFIVELPHARGLHSSTSQLNLSALHGIGGARIRCVALFKGVLGGV